MRFGLLRVYWRPLTLSDWLPWKLTASGVDHSGFDPRWITPVPVGGSIRMFAKHSDRCFKYDEAIPLVDDARHETKAPLGQTSLLH